MELLLDWVCFLIKRLGIGRVMRGMERKFVTNDAFQFDINYVLLFIIGNNNMKFYLIKHQSRSYDCTCNNTDLELPSDVPKMYCLCIYEFVHVFIIVSCDDWRNAIGPFLTKLKENVKITVNETPNSVTLNFTTFPTLFALWS